ncbi:MAG: tRNA lysidine(34) synthetase TilS [Gammaproteobacteria bacterium]
MLDSERILALLSAQPRVRRWLVGYSGGVDSHVLLHWFANHRIVLPGQQVTAIYVDHGLQPEARHWGEHCAAVCQALGIAYRQLRIDAQPQRGESPEAAARRARYRACAGLLTEHDAFVTAHHQDDQAETMLLQLLRGAGPRGLAAMPAVAALGQGLLVRPLLEFGRAEILAYAGQHGLAWISDPSNAQRDFNRNYLRHEVMPQIVARWPAAGRTLARSAVLCAEAAALMDELATLDLQRAASLHLDRLRVSVLRELSASRQRNALRLWFQRLGLSTPQHTHLDRILTDVIAAPGDREPLIRWPGCEVRRYRDELFALPPLPPHAAGQVIPWSGLEPLSIPGLGTLMLAPAARTGLCGEALRQKEITVRFRRGGERLRPAGRRHVHELKKLLQEAGVPPWERGRIPLLYVGEELAAVAGLWVSAGFVTATPNEGLILEWRRSG